MLFYSDYDLLNSLYIVSASLGQKINLVEVLTLLVMVVPRVFSMSVSSDRKNGTNQLSIRKYTTCYGKENI